MLAKSLTVAAFILGLGVVAGCDDPEVQSKVADLMEHGSVSAELHCDLTKTFSKPVVTLTRNHLSYSAQKMVDGSCYMHVCLLNSNVGTVNGAAISECYARLYARSDTNAETCSFLFPISLISGHPTYPYRPGVDGAQFAVEDGYLSAEFIENEFNDNSPDCGGGGGSCNEVEPWFTHDITTSGCTGRNLEAFGATP